MDELDPIEFVEKHFLERFVLVLQQAILLDQELVSVRQKLAFLDQ